MTEELFGLPAHPLVVHAAVVLLPLAAVATLVSAAVSRLRPYYAPVALAVAVAATIAVGLAQTSGEELEDQVDETELVEDHTEQGESVLPWAVAVTVVAAAVTAVPMLGRRLATRPARAVTAALVVVALVAGPGRRGPSLTSGTAARRRRGTTWATRTAGTREHMVRPRVTRSVW